MLKLRKAAVIAPYLIQGLFIILLADFAFGLSDYDLRVPFSYIGDTVIQLMYVQGLLLNGWTWTIPQLSAPFEMSGAAFPLMTSLDWSIMKLLSPFAPTPGLLLNVFWLATLVLSGWSTLLALRILDIQWWVAGVAGILYAFLPYALFRNVAHLNLVYYLVPLAAVLAISIASGQHADLAKWKKNLLYASCIALGFNYIYFSFFSVGLFAFAALYGWINHRSTHIIRVALVCSALVVGATALNLTPTFYSWHQQGYPPEMIVKSPAEAEVYAAKIRRMLSPHQDNRVDVLANWARADITAGYPNENENLSARLGLMAGLGFVLLILVSLRIVDTTRLAGTHADQLGAIAALTLFTLLMITVGGFGALFNLAVSEQIRAYNRFSVIIAFFSFAALSLVLQQYRAKRSARANIGLLVVFTLLAGFSLYDQLLDRASMLDRQAGDTQEYLAEQRIMSEFSSLYPNGVATLQLPLTGFPSLSMHGQMQSYDHLRPFLFADRNMRWSWPSFSNAHREWQNRIAGLTGGELIAAASTSGFGVIWINRSGYEDRAQELIEGLVRAGAVIVLDDGRHLILDIGQTTGSS